MVINTQTGAEIDHAHGSSRRAYGNSPYIARSAIRAKIGMTRMNFERKNRVFGQSQKNTEGLKTGL